MNDKHLQAANAPRHILVVGDSCAAWMVIAFFKKLYAHPCSGLQADKPDVRLTLITHDESQVFPAPVSVLPGFRAFIDYLGVSERDFLAQTAGAFKLANVYRGWAAHSHTHIQAFGACGAPMAFVDFPQVYQNLRTHQQPLEELHEFSLAAQAARRDLFQHPSADPGSIYSGLAYGLRFDEQRFRQWLVDWSAAEVECIKARVDDVQLRGCDTVVSVKANACELRADLVIDCSAERVVARALPGASPGAIAQWDSAIGSDLRVRAIAGQNPGNLSCDLLTAKSAGLESLQPDREKLCLNLFTSSEQMNAKTLEQFKRTFARSKWEIKQHINFSCLEPWRGNCISIGPAAVNINTAVVSNLDLCWLGLAPLVKFSPLQTACPEMARAYNETVRIQYERVKDHIVLLRELAAARGERFWQVERAVDYSQDMINKLTLYDRRGLFPMIEYGPFDSREQLLLLLGLQRYPASISPLSLGLDRNAVLAHAQKIRAAIASALRAMPSQKQYLDKYLAHE